MGKGSGSLGQQQVAHERRRVTFRHGSCVTINITRIEKCAEANRNQFRLPCVDTVILAEDFDRNPLEDKVLKLRNSRAFSNVQEIRYE